MSELDWSRTPDRELFPRDYLSSRAAFLHAAGQAGWQIESHLRPGGANLVTDVAICGTDRPARVLFISSGLHGVEAFHGAAIQRMILSAVSPEDSARRDARIVLVHALNPFGFAELRRVDEQNIDPNRNFLLPGENHTGVSDTYRRLETMLNPRQWPRAEVPFSLKALWAICRSGLPGLKQAIAEGQYEFPSGLFFGGREPCSTRRFLESHLNRWLAGAPDVLHLDIHSGLGRYGRCMLLLDHPLTAPERASVQRMFGDRIRFPDSPTRAYGCRGSISRWMRSRPGSGRIVSLCAEFGTYNVVSVVGALRAENAAHQYADPNLAARQRSKSRMVEMFAPASDRWRRSVVLEARGLIEAALSGWLWQEPHCPAG